MINENKIVPKLTPKSINPRTPWLTIMHTQSGNQALKYVLCSKCTFGMIILDRNLGDKSPNGDEICRRLRSSGYGGMIVGVTGDALEAQRESFLNSGLTSIALKGDRNEGDLLVKVCEALAKRRAPRHARKFKDDGGRKGEGEGEDGKEEGGERGGEGDKENDKRVGRAGEDKGQGNDSPYLQIFTALGNDKESIQNVKEMIAGTIGEQIETLEGVARDFASGGAAGKNAWKGIHAVAGGYKLMKVDFAARMGELELAMRDQNTCKMTKEEIEEEIAGCLDWLVGLRAAVHK